MLNTCIQVPPLNLDAPEEHMPYDSGQRIWVKVSLALSFIIWIGRLRPCATSSGILVLGTDVIIGYYLHTIVGSLVLLVKVYSVLP